MRKGGGKGKGSSFERKVCKALSLWVSGGKSEDCFWRSAMSGGRATVRHLQGIKIRQVGDICATTKEGHQLTDYWFIECKHVKSLSVGSFLLSNTGPLAKFWKIAQAEANKHELKPMIIAKQNNGPVIVVTPIGKAERWTTPQLTSHARYCDISLLEDILLSDEFKMKVRTMKIKRRGWYR